MGSAIWLIFTVRHFAKRGTCRRRVSVRPSVCLCMCVCVCVSVTLRYCMKTAKRRITQIMPHDRPGTLSLYIDKRVAQSLCHSRASCYHLFLGKIQNPLTIGDWFLQQVGRKIYVWQRILYVYSGGSMRGGANRHLSPKYQYSFSHADPWL